MCLNWKVLGGLGIAGVVVLLVAPGAAGAALPVLFALACSLSMLLMMRGMIGGRSASTPKGTCSTQEDRATVIARLEDELATLKASAEARAGRLEQQPSTPVTGTQSRARAAAPSSTR